jgi:hypothetical protein
MLRKTWIETEILPRSRREGEGQPLNIELQLKLQGVGAVKTICGNDVMGMPVGP